MSAPCNANIIDLMNERIGMCAQTGSVSFNIDRAEVERLRKDHADARLSILVAENLRSKHGWSPA